MNLPVFENKAITKVRAGKIIIKLNFSNNFREAYRFYYIQRNSFLGDVVW